MTDYLDPVADNFSIISFITCKFSQKTLSKGLTYFREDYSYHDFVSDTFEACEGFNFHQCLLFL